MFRGFALKIVVIFLLLGVISSQNSNGEQNRRPVFDILSSLLDRVKEPQLRERQNILGAIAGKINDFKNNGFGNRRRNRPPNNSQNTEATTTTTAIPKVVETTPIPVISNVDSGTPISILKSELGNQQKNQKILDVSTPKPIVRRPPIPGLQRDDEDTATPKTKLPSDDELLNVFGTTPIPKASKRPPIPGLPTDDKADPPKNQGFEEFKTQDKTDQALFDVFGTTTPKPKAPKRPLIPGLPSEEDDAPKNCTVLVTNSTMPRKPAIPGLPSEEEDLCGEDGVGNRIDPNALKSLIG